MIHSFLAEPDVEKLIALKALESLSLLKLIAPLAKHRGRLTAAQQGLLIDTVNSAESVLREASNVYWQAYTRHEDAKKTDAAVRKVET